MNIATRDFNLLYLFTVLYEERNLSRCQNRMHLSQPALSHKLNKLRNEFDDPLFVRTGRGLVPTPKAESLAPEITHLVKSLEQFYHRSEDIALSQRTDRIRILTTDFMQLILLPGLYKRLREVAPNVTLVVQYANGSLPLQALENGDCDLVIAGFYKNLPNYLYRQSLSSYTFSLLHDQAYFEGKDEMNLDEYCARSHVVTTLTGDLNGIIDASLERLGRSRKVVMGASSFLALPHVITDSPLVLACLTPIAEHFKTICTSLCLSNLPFASPVIEIEQIWHPRTHEDALRKWLRNEVKLILQQQNTGT